MIANYPGLFATGHADIIKNAICPGIQIALISNLSNIVNNVLQDLNNGYLKYLNNLNPSDDYNATFYSELIPTDQ